MSDHKTDHKYCNPSFMIKINIYILASFLLVSVSLKSQTLSAEQIYKKVSDAVVVIHTYNSNDELLKQGSGVIIKDKGYVVTNYHVFAGCERIEISHNKKIIPLLDIIGIDVNKDILILKIEMTKAPQLKISNLSSLRVGQKVFTVGSPLGLENSISEGIISGLRSNNEMGRNFIQITAGISPGSSGGAVVNDRGELIGISTLSSKEGQNINFAIPIDDVFNVVINSYSKNNAYKDYEFFYKGTDALEKGDYYNAIEHLSIFIDKYPNNELAHLFCGYAKMELENISGSIQHFDKAININPNSTEAYHFRGEAFRLLKKYNEAIQDYNKAIQINSQNSNAYYSLGLTKSLLNEYISALKDLNKAIEIEPSLGFYYSLRGIIKNSLDDKYGACKDFSKAGELGDYKAYDYIKLFCK